MSLRDVSPEAIEARLERLRQCGDDYAEAYAQANYLDEYTKSLLAILMKEHEGLGHKTTAAQEREARADKRFVEHLQALREAVRIREKYRHELRCVETGVGVWQTMRADQRAEEKAYRNS